MTDLTRCRVRVQSTVLSSPWFLGGGFVKTSHGWRGRVRLVTLSGKTGVSAPPGEFRVTRSSLHFVSATQQHNCMCTGRTTRAPPRTAVPGEGSAAALTMALTDLTPLRQAVDVLSSSRRRRPGYVHKYGINVLKITSRNLYAASARLYLTTSSQFCSQ